MNVKSTARLILILIVFVGALIYVVDFINPLTPDPPVILKSLQWWSLVIFVVGIGSLTLHGLRAHLHNPLLENRYSPATERPGPPNTSWSVIDRTCSRLI